MWVTMPNGKKKWISHHTDSFDRDIPNDERKIIPQGRMNDAQLKQEVTKLHKMEDEAKKQGKSYVMYKGMKINFLN